MLDIKRDILPLKNIMYRLALRITLNSQEAEDIVQDVIIKLWKKSLPPQPSTLERGREINTETPKIENLEAYALRMVRNLAFDRQRMRVNNTEDIEGLDFDSGKTHPELVVGSIEHTMEQQEKIDSIRKLMEQLPEKQRTAMQLRDFEGKQYKEIAEVMEISEDQVKVCIFRARQFIKNNISSRM